MKTPRGARPHDTDERRKANRFEPMRKSGKERHRLFGRIDEAEEDEPCAERETALDYLDDAE